MANALAYYNGAVKKFYSAGRKLYFVSIGFAVLGFSSMTHNCFPTKGRGGGRISPGLILAKNVCPNLKVHLRLLGNAFKHKKFHKDYESVYLFSTASSG